VRDRGGHRAQRIASLVTMPCRKVARYSAHTAVVTLASWLGKRIS